MRLTYWTGPIDNLGGLFRTMGVTLVDDAICRQVRRFVRHWGRQRRRSKNAENVIVSLVWSPSRGVDAEASRISYL
ncbi:MAG: hypothetical protein GXY47_06320 [Acidobacteria bacterium]|nr:hypothetical protein [Acidobacteriota bacterium]